MGQTRDEVKNNIVRIFDKDGNSCGTGFFINKEHCATCHHNIWELDEIYIGRHPEKKYLAEWSEEYSDMNKDIAIIRVSNSPYKDLICGQDTFSKLPVVVRGFPNEDRAALTTGVTSGIVVEGTLGDNLEDYESEEEAGSELHAWNKKPKVTLEVFPLISDDKFVKGFSGAPIFHKHDLKSLV